MKLKKSYLLIAVLPFSVSMAYSSQAEIGVMGRITSKDEGNSFSAGVYAAKNTYGMRANAVVMAARANAYDYNKDGYPVSGFSYTKALSSYGDRDSVGLYADNTSNPFSHWEKVDSTIYMPTSVSSPSLDTKNIKPGMLLDVGADKRWSAYVIAAHDNKIITNGWVNNDTKSLGVPPNGLQLFINPITKIWAANFNIFLKEGGKAKSGVIQENGLVNNENKKPNAINGIDTVILPISKYGGTAAYLARSARSGNQQQWEMGFVSQGANLSNFYSADVSPEKSPQAGYIENSSASAGFVFYGKNKNSSIEWRSNGKIMSKISPDGRVMKLSYRTLVLNDSRKLLDDYFKYIVVAKKNINITLPEKSTIPDGYTIEIDRFSNCEIKFYGDATINLNNDGSRRIVATFANGEWYVM